jgi:hypothetical protein
MTPDFRRRLSLLAAGIVLLAVMAGFSISVSGWFRMQSDIDTAISGQAVPPAADPARYLSPGENHAVAGSNLQTRLNEAARQSGLTTGRVNIAPADAGDPLAIVLEFQAEGELENIARLLHSIESTLPALIVEDARLTPLRNSQRLQLTATIRARREPGGAS